MLLTVNKKLYKASPIASLDLTLGDLEKLKVTTEILKSYILQSSRVTPCVTIKR